MLSNIIVVKNNNWHTNCLINYERNKANLGFLGKVRRLSSESWKNAIVIKIYCRGVTV